MLKSFYDLIFGACSFNFQNNQKYTFNFLKHFFFSFSPSRRLHEKSVEATDPCESVDLSLALNIRPRLELVDPIGVVG